MLHKMERTLMKNPLFYQFTEFDCGPTSILNAITYLYERQEIPPDFLKYIMQYCMDSYNEKGEQYRYGTSTDAMNYMAAWFNQYAKAVGFPICCKHICGSKVYLSKESPIYECLKQGGAVVARCYLTVPHYITLTGIDDDYVYAFDAYYETNPEKREGVICIEGMPKRMNRKIEWKVMDNDGKGDYSLGDASFRDVTLFYKKAVS